MGEKGRRGYFDRLDLAWKSSQRFEGSQVFERDMETLEFRNEPMSPEEIKTRLEKQSKETEKNEGTTTNEGIEVSNAIQVSTKGELLAAIDLIEEGWSIAKPQPDVGIDLVATKIEQHEVKVKCVQVKTSERYDLVKNICRKKSHNLYGFNFDQIIQGCEYWFVFIKNEESKIIKLKAAELERKIY